MKKIKFIAILVVLVGWLTACKEQQNESSLMLFDRVVLSGCNLGYEDWLANDSEIKYGYGVFSYSSDDYLRKSSVTITVSEDSVSVFVALWFICAAPFETKVETASDVVGMYIIDTCRIGYDECYARCHCEYTFDFIFKRENNQSKLYQKYKIVLISPLREAPVVVSEGVIMSN